MAFSTFFQSANIKSIQRGTIVITYSATSNTATISAVDTSKSVLINLGIDLPVNANGYFHGRLELTNSTTVTARGYAANTFPLTVGYEVVEYL